MRLYFFIRATFATLLPSDYNQLIMAYTKGLDTPIQFIKGVGPKRAELFASCGINNVRDLMDYFPRRYQFFGEVKTLKELTEGETATVVVQIDQVSHVYYRKPSRIFASISDKTDSGIVRWFNCKFLEDKLKEGQWMRVSGKVQISAEGPMFTNPKCEFFDSAPGDVSGSYTLPVYPAISRVAPKTLANMIQQTLQSYKNQLVDWFAGDMLEKMKLLPIQQAYDWIHQPEMLEHWTQARGRLAYDELFFMQLGMLLVRRNRKLNNQAVRLGCNDNVDDHIRRRFPFKLTGAQNRVITEIVADLNTHQPMYRLLQGDVGAGKTVVALYAALVAVANKRQVAIMAPTEILAQQHYDKLVKYLEGSRVRIELLVGGMPKKRRTEIISSATNGEVDILIGTQALIQKDVEFAKLGLVIIDEQHKFGVAQRMAIKSKGVQPHYLIMTATPIPRTLSLTIFGDLQISTIDELPPGRKPIETSLHPYLMRQGVWEFLRKRLAKGEQGFVVYPLLDPSDKLELRSAKEEKEILENTIFPEFKVGLIHGKMKSEEKKEIMKAFAAKEIDLLVATIVIEVGIDVPDASVLVIEHGERFGLSQLHQLRGRIGRGGQQAYCMILADIKGEVANKRLDVFARTLDGFKIAEEDLRLRGPGEFFGTAQHGLPELKLADLIEDYMLLVKARQYATEILTSDPNLTKIEHKLIRKELVRRLGKKLGFIEAA